MKMGLHFFFLHYVQTILIIIIKQEIIVAYKVEH